MIPDPALAAMLTATRASILSTLAQIQSLLEDLAVKWDIDLEEPT